METNPYESSQSTPAPAQTGKAARGLLFLCVFIDLLGFGIVLPLLPVYGEQLSADETGLTVGLLMSSFSAMQFFCSPLWGRLSDRIGRRPVLLIGLTGSVVFYALFGVATVARSLTLLFISRIGAGVAGATISTAQAYIADTTSSQDRASGMALIGAAFGMGFTFGPLFGMLALLGGTKEGLSPWPGYAAAGLSGVALLVACFKLPESLHRDSHTASRKLLDLAALGEALTIPSIAGLLLASFVCVFSFSNFEATLSLLVKEATGPFRLDFSHLFLVFAYIGVVLSIAQGVIVRRLSKRVPEGTLAATGAVIEVGGFILLVEASRMGSLGMLMGALTVVVSGFAFVTPSLNSLISRRSDPARQGSILGLNQSISALARILGPLAGIPLFFSHHTFPLWLAAGLMSFGLVLVITAARRGRDWASSST